MNNKRRIVIVGATSSIAEHCARLWATGEPTELTLVGRDIARTERVAADLRVRSPQSNVLTVISDFLDPSSIEVTVSRIADGGPIDIALIAHGSLPDQNDCQDDLRTCRDALEVNGVSPVLFAEAFAKYMLQTNNGTLALIASVAGDRGRKSNYVYGSAKGLVIRYAEGLQHRLAGSRVKVVLIKPGPTDTPMTAHLKANAAKLTSVDIVSSQIVEGIARAKSVIYTPKRWSLIMWIICRMPRFLFHKLDI